MMYDNLLLICYASDKEKSRRPLMLDARVAKLESTLLQPSDGTPPIPLKGLPPSHKGIGLISVSTPHNTAP